MVVIKKSGNLHSVLSSADPEVTDRGVLKSAIQKAYRRNDAILFNWVFEKLWAVESSWVFWRAPILPAEENWQGMLDIGRTQYELQQKYPGKELLMTAPDTKPNVKASLLRLMKTAKDKDGDGLRIVGLYWHRNRTRWEKPILNSLRDEADLKLVMMAAELEAQTEGMKFLPRQVWAPIWDMVGEFEEKLSEQEYLDLRQAVGSCYFRAKKGGMMGDQTMLYCTALVLMDSVARFGGLLPPMPSNQMKLEDSMGVVPVQVPNRVPWYAADMHTVPGKKVLGWTAKSHGWDKRKLTEAWFLFESGVVNEVAPTQMWWGLNEKLGAVYFGHDTVEEFQDWWVTKAGPIVKARVRYLLQEAGITIA